MPLDIEHIEADLAVIGFGKGGKTLAATLGRQGRRVVMIEQSALMYGGTCINIGCVPTKSMVYRSEHLPAGDVHPQNYHRAVDATAELTTELRAVNFAMLDNLDTVTV
ncbi:MAG: FAD-dependent oxidoreductase, partial [Mycolicibacterium aromaticivorans]|nr:FAD-dependent oxidoreductase [Mycolicibacterium aromaticivorans]